MSDAQQENDVEQEPLVSEVSSQRTMVSPMFAVVTCALVCALLLTAYHFGVARHQGPRFGVVDVSEVLRLEQLKVSAIALKDGATDKDREAAYDQIREFGPQMERAVQDLQGECKCVLLVRAAVVSGLDNDWTVALKRKLDLDSVSPERLREQIAGQPLREKVDSALASKIPALEGASGGISR